MAYCTFCGSDRMESGVDPYYCSPECSWEAEIRYRADMRNYTRIVTHAGMFHADEVLAIALMRVLGCTAPVERTYTPTAEDLKDPGVLVLDVGKVYDAERGCFDHHQDGALEATNVLLLRYFEDVIGLRVATELAKRLFFRVSDVDRGNVVLSDEGRTLVPEFNSLIRAFNNLDNGFDRAVQVATEILTAQLETAKKALADVDRWYALEKSGGVAFQHDTDVILGWKEKAKEEGIFLLVCPNLRGGYSVISRDTAELVIPAQENQTFRHASGFMATYPTLADATAHAVALSPVHA